MTRWVIRNKETQELFWGFEGMSDKIVYWNTNPHLYWRECDATFVLSVCELYNDHEVVEYEREEND